MNKALFDQLNTVYAPMWGKATEIQNHLAAAGYAAAAAFYNNHYVKKDDGDFAVEHFPIPVITVAGVGDIGVDLDNYWIEIHLDKSRAASLDYPRLTQLYNMEVYGAEGFCLDFYNAQSDPHEVAEKINNSGEILVHVTIYLAPDSDTEEVVGIVKRFA